MRERCRGATGLCFTPVSRYVLPVHLIHYSRCSRHCRLACLSLLLSRTLRQHTRCSEERTTPLTAPQSTTTSPFQRTSVPSTMHQPRTFHTPYPRTIHTDMMSSLRYLSSRQSRLLQLCGNHCQQAILRYTRRATSKSTYMLTSTGNG